MLIFIIICEDEKEKMNFNFKIQTRKFCTKTNEIKINNKKNNNNNNLNDNNNINNLNNDDDNNNLNNNKLNEINSPRRTVRYFQSDLTHQKNFMSQLGAKLNIKSLDEWIKVPKSILYKKGGRALLKIYSNNLKKLFQTIFPEHDWKFEEIDYKKQQKLRKEMDKLYKKFKLTSLDDWLQVARTRMVHEVLGKRLLEENENSMKLLLKKAYPHQNWNFNSLKIFPHDYFKLINNQRDFMDHLTRKFQLNDLNEWIFVTKRKFLKNGGQSLLCYYYHSNLNHLLLSIYPNFPWNFDKSLNKIENQILEMNLIAKKLKIKKLDDWIEIGKYKFTLNGGSRLLNYYNNDMKKLLKNIFPNYLFNFDHHKFRPNIHYSKTFEFNYNKIKLLIKKENIKEKKDWYRLNTNININDELINLILALKIVFPNEKWSKKEFIYRSKKTIQRKLFNLLLILYSEFNLYENYKHPYLSHHLSERFLEFDIFHPSLNIAFEYQGQQHFDDIPSGFGLIESYLSRDIVKIQLAKENNIFLIVVPYWWDQSIISLQSTIYDQFNVFCK